MKYSFINNFGIAFPLWGAFSFTHYNEFFVLWPLEFYAFSQLRVYAVIRGILCLEMEYKA
jgi:hypothetical protein